MEVERECEKEQHEKEMLELKLKLPKDADGDKVSPAKAPCLKLPPPFDEIKDNLDSYIERFERFAGSQKWPPSSWAINLRALLKGKALEVYSRMPPDDALVYAKLKTALLKRFQLTEEGYRVKVRTRLVYL